MNHPDLTGLSLPDHNRLASSINDRLDARRDQLISCCNIISICVLFQSSGMASLICEAVWFKNCDSSWEARPFRSAWWWPLSSEGSRSAAMSTPGPWFPSTRRTRNG